MIEREKVGNNDTLNAIFEDLYNLLSEANRIPLTDKIIVEESDISGILEDLREAIPARSAMRARSWKTSTTS